jgi:hypothetical protein
LYVYQMNVKMTFLNRDLKESVYGANWELYFQMRKKKSVYW